MLMVWDEPKRLSNLNDHGLDFADASDRFEWQTAIVGDTYADPATEKPRFSAIGFLDGALVHLVFAPLGSEAVSAISLPTASNRERRRYEQG